MPLFIDVSAEVAIEGDVCFVITTSELMTPDTG